VSGTCLGQHVLASMPRTACPRQHVYVSPPAPDLSSVPVWVSLLDVIFEFQQHVGHVHYPWAPCDTPQAHHSKEQQVSTAGTAWRMSSTRNRGAAFLQIHLLVLPEVDGPATRSLSSGSWYCLTHHHCTTRGSQPSHGLAT
jgi:hypothetical protein